MISKAANFVQADATDSEVKSTVLGMLNAGIAIINSRRWHKLTGSEDLTMAAADDDIGVATTFKEPVACFRLNSSDDRIGRLPFRPLRSLLMERPNNATAGSPRAYGIDYPNRNLILDVQPSATWVAANPKLRLYQHIRLAELAADGDQTGGEPEFDWFIVWHARRELAAQREPEKFGLADRMAEQIYRELRRSDTDQMSDWDDSVIY